MDSYPLHKFQGTPEELAELIESCDLADKRTDLRTERPALDQGEIVASTDELRWLVAAARENEWAKTALGLVATQLVACREKLDDAPMSAGSHLDEAIAVLAGYEPIGGELTEAQVKLRNEVWTAGREMARENAKLRERIVELEKVRAPLLKCDPNTGEITNLTDERMREQLRRACALLRALNYMDREVDAFLREVGDHG